MERDLNAVARRQHSMVSRRQALDAGLTDQMIATRLAQGHWGHPHPGVYRVGAGPDTPEAKLFAAHLAAGPSSVVSHGSAAYLWNLARAPERPVLTVPRTLGPRVAGCIVHRSRDLDWDRVRTRGGLPCTDPLRTIVDLAQELPPGRLDELVDRALHSRLVTVEALVAELERLGRPGRRGVGALRAALGRRGLTGGPTPSALEQRGRAFLRRYTIPLAGAELRAGPLGEFRVDFVLVDGVVFELDGYVWHFSPEHKQRDEARRRTLQLAGDLVLVATWRDLEDRPRQLAAELLQAVAQAPGRLKRPASAGRQPA